MRHLDRYEGEAAWQVFSPDPADQRDRLRRLHFDILDGRTARTNVRRPVTNWAGASSDASCNHDTGHELPSDSKPTC